MELPLHSTNEALQKQDELIVVSIGPAPIAHELDALVIFLLSHNQFHDHSCSFESSDLPEEVMVEKRVEPRVIRLETGDHPLGLFKHRFFLIWNHHKSH